MHNRFASTTETLTWRHHQRLRDRYRSARWPCHDMLEVELLAAGMLERIDSASGHQIVRVTDSGVTQLAHGFARNKVCCTPHEALVEKLAPAMARAGPVLWRGLGLRAKVRAPKRLPDAEAQSPSRWCVACPDVASIMLCEGDRLVVGCPALRGPQQTLPFRVWMSPSKGSPLGMHDASQALLQGPVEAWTR
ncbi:MAG: hypothetical protein H7274_14540 [Rhodoferax sp.]|nr:hypothetical protein [Rhodoferax sp.]